MRDPREMMEDESPRLELEHRIEQMEVMRRRVEEHRIRQMEVMSRREEEHRIKQMEVMRRSEVEDWISLMEYQRRREEEDRIRQMEVMRRREEYWRGSAESERQRMEDLRRREQAFMRSNGRLDYSTLYDPYPRQAMQDSESQPRMENFFDFTQDYNRPRVPASSINTRRSPHASSQSTQRLSEVITHPFNGAPLNVIHNPASSPFPQRESQTPRVRSEVILGSDDQPNELQRDSRILRQRQRDYVNSIASSRTPVPVNESEDQYRMRIRELRAASRAAPGLTAVSQNENHNQDPYDWDQELSRQLAQREITAVSSLVSLRQSMDQEPPAVPPAPQPPQAVPPAPRRPGVPSLEQLQQYHNASNWYDELESERFSQLLAHDINNQSRSDMNRNINPDLRSDDLYEDLLDEELLSQLSSVRSRAAAAQSVSSQLQQLEMQLQSTRQQLERMPRRQGEANKVPPGTATAPIANPESGLISSQSSNSSTESLFLLTKIIEESQSGSTKSNGGGSDPDCVEKNIFIQELLLSTMSEQFSQSTLTDDPMQFLESPSSPQRRSERTPSTLASGSDTGACGSDALVTGAHDELRAGRVTVVEASCQSKSTLGSSSSTAATGGSKPVSPTPGSSKGAAASQSEGRNVAMANLMAASASSQPASRPPHLAAGSSSPPSSQPHGSTVNLNEHAMNDPPPAPPPRQAAGSLSPRDANRLNPAAAKRGMLKQSPTSRGGATDMDPPPH